MQSALHSEPRVQRQRARFDALRQKIFGEMGRATIRWRLTWILPFHTLVFVVLASRGLETWRVLSLGAVLLVTSTLFVAQVFWRSGERKLTSMFIGSMCAFGALSVTGGIESPLVITVVPMLIGAALGIHHRGGAKACFFVFFLVSFVGLAFLSRLEIGRLPVPLASTDGWPTAEYVTIAVMSAGFVVMGAYRMGSTITQGYEQVAFELAERREELCTENADRTKELEGIAARLAHEVKNPLAAIKGLSAHMARNSADPKTAERLAIVAAEADRLQGIVDGFLSFSRGFDEPKVAPTKLSEVARELALLLETRAADGGVALQVTGDADLTVNADGRKLRQALLNIVLNAMQASSNGKTVTIDIGRSKGSVQIRVTDEGPGMTAEVLDRIRKPYFTTKEGGTGLGVAVARGLIEQHGGQLRYESSPGRGTTVTVELPYCSKRFCQMSALPNPLRPAEAQSPVQSPGHGAELSVEAVAP